MTAQLSTASFARPIDLAGWMKVMQVEPKDDVEAVRQAHVVKLLESAHIRNCRDEHVLTDFLNFLGRARRGSATGAAAVIVREFTRGRISSLATAAEDQLNRIYLTSTKYADELTREVDSILLAVHDESYRIAS